MKAIIILYWQVNFNASVLGLMINFGQEYVKDGIIRVVNGL
jgi:hypothetical protein